MDRTWLETVHMLGLDVEIAIVAVMVALEALSRLVEHLRADHRARRPDAGRTFLPSPAAWPPEGWRSNH
jgi:hypothetical protein